MALSYTVNWIEQARNPQESGDSGSYETIQTESRLVLYNNRYWRQSRSRTGTVSYSSTTTFCQVTYKADTVTASGVTTQITASQAAEIQADAYTQGCVSCTTARESGPNFGVTKVEQLATPLVSTTTKSTTWEEWGDWGPTIPGYVEPQQEGAQND